MGPTQLQAVGEGLYREDQKNQAGLRLPIDQNKTSEESESNMFINMS
jgi:hypothetical protein